MDKKIQGILGLVIGVLMFAAYGWYNNSTKTKLANEASIEICKCMEDSFGDDEIANQVSTSICLKLLSKDGFRSLSVDNLEDALEENCPQYAEQVEITEK